MRLWPGPKGPTPLETAAAAVRQEADSAFAERKQALRDALRKLGGSLDQATAELIDTMARTNQ